MKASTIAASAAAFLAAAAFTQSGLAADRYILVKNNYAKEYVWITTYNTLPRQIQYGCVNPGETKTFTDNQYGNSFRIRAEVMTAAACKGTKLCDTDAASSNAASFTVNRNKTNPNNCYINYGDKN